MSNERTAQLFNEWMRRYTEDPDGFEHSWSTIKEYLSTPDGEEPSYGQSCAAYLAQLDAEVPA